MMEGPTALRSTIWLKSSGAASSVVANLGSAFDTYFSLVLMRLACRTSSTPRQKKFQIQITSRKAYDALPGTLHELCKEAGGPYITCNPVFDPADFRITIVWQNRFTTVRFLQYL